MTQTLASGFGDDSEPRILTNGIHLTMAPFPCYTQQAAASRLFCHMSSYRLLTHCSGPEQWGGKVISRHHS